MGKTLSSSHSPNDSPSAAQAGSKSWKPGKKSMNQYLHQKLKAKITENLEAVDRSSCGSWKARVLQVFKNLPSSIFLASHYKLSYLHSECVFCLLARIVRASSDSKLRHWSGKKKENRTLSCFSCVVSHLFTFDPLIFVYPSYHMHPFQRFKNDYNSKNVTRRKILPPNSECFRNSNSVCGTYLEIKFPKGDTIVFRCVHFGFKMAGKKPHNGANVSSIHNFRYFYRQRVLFVLCNKWLN